MREKISEKERKIFYKGATERNRVQEYEFVYVVALDKCEREKKTMNFNAALPYQ